MIQRINSTQSNHHIVVCQSGWITLILFNENKLNCNILWVQITIDFLPILWFFSPCVLLLLLSSVGVFASVIVILLLLFIDWFLNVINHAIIQHNNSALEINNSNTLFFLTLPYLVDSHVFYSRSVGVVPHQPVRWFNTRLHLSQPYTDH